MNDKRWGEAVDKAHEFAQELTEKLQADTPPDLMPMNLAILMQTCIEFLVCYGFTKDCILERIGEYLDDIDPDDLIRINW